MNKFFAGGAALLATATLAQAGGIDRSGRDIGFIFEDGEAAFGSLGYVMPSINSNPEAAAGDVGQDYLQLSFGYKRPLGDNLELALIFDQPYGADISYPGGPLAGTEATVTSGAVTGILRYRIDETFSVHGGLRIQSIRGEAAVPRAGGYTLDTDSSMGVGYMIGTAYEREDIALRVALTYHSAIEHTLQSTEVGGIEDEFDIKTPQSVALDFQTGIAQDTLLFGQVRWTDWSEFDITPENYLPGSLVDYDEDVYTYTVGIGRRFSETLSGSFSVSYEKSTGEPAPNLGPTDGRTSYTLGLAYAATDKMTIRGGVSYVDIGSATTTSGITFDDSSAIGVGASVLYTF